jgi:DNA-binding transcriptional ArsR family regulator
VTAIFGALADESRRRILDLLADGERPVGDLVDLVGLSQPSVSRHLKALRAAGLVESRTQGQRRLYRVIPEPLRDVDDWLTPYRGQWAGPLNALERHMQIMGDAELDADGGLGGLA